MPNEPRIDTTVAPDFSIAGQKPDTENLGAKEMVAPTSITETTPVAMAFMWKSGRGVQ
ncbi:hypothetical protein D3C77_448030 [compost metagenome]